MYSTRGLHKWIKIHIEKNILIFKSKKHGSRIGVFFLIDVAKQKFQRKTDLIFTEQKCVTEGIEMNIKTVLNISVCTVDVYLQNSYKIQSLYRAQQMPMKRLISILFHLSSEYTVKRYTHHNEIGYKYKK